MVCKLFCFIISFSFSLDLLPIQNRELRILSKTFYIHYDDFFIRNNFENDDVSLLIMKYHELLEINEKIANANQNDITLNDRQYGERNVSPSRIRTFVCMIFRTNIKNNERSHMSIKKLKKNRKSILKEIKKLETILKPLFRNFIGLKNGIWYRVRYFIR